MENIRTLLTREHRSCDGLLAAVEEAVEQRHWQDAERLFTDFVAHMELHLGKEEEILFPTLEERMGASLGPVQVMRHEHEDMRRLFQEIQEDISKRQSEHCLGLSDTLLMLIQQHNLKEENILYPMADRVLGGEQEEILARLRAMDRKN